MKKVVLLNLVFIFSIFCSFGQVQLNNNSWEISVKDNNENIIKGVSLENLNKINIIPIENNIKGIYKPYKTQINNKQHNLMKFYNGVLSSSSFTDVLSNKQYIYASVSTSQQKIQFAQFDYSLDEKCYSALELVPRFMRTNLFLKFRDLKAYNLDGTYAQIILDAYNEDPQITDEVAFTIAHLSVNVLSNNRIEEDMSLIIENAKYIYMVDDDLKYVDLVEYGDQETGDYYTTTKYKVKNGSDGEFVWFELPYEYYYWYIVSPKLNLEGVYKADNTSDAAQRTYDYFWRSFLWDNPDASHDYTDVNISTSLGSVTTISKLKDIMSQPDILWDREYAFYYFGRDYSDDDYAMNKLCNWASRAVPADPYASAPRPHQPNQIVVENRGRCGEDSYLCAAAARTCLIPAIILTTTREDHAFTTFWDQDWKHFEFFRGGLAQNGWGWTNLMNRGYYEELAPDYWILSYVYGFRPDGYLMDFTKYYTDICDLELFVADKDGNPIDGAKVVIYAAPGHPGDNSISYSAEQFTDYNGKVSFNLGDYKYYLYQVYHEDYGYIPGEGQANIIVGSIIGGQVGGGKSKAGAYYADTVNYSSASIPSFKVQELKYDKENYEYAVKLHLKISDIITGVNTRDGMQSKFYKFNDDSTGNISVMILDDENYTNFKDNKNFNAYSVIINTAANETIIPIPDDSKNWNVLLSNQSVTNNYKYINVTAELLHGSFSSVTDHVEEIHYVYPNPFDERCVIDFPSDVKEIQIYDINGNVIENKAGNKIIWEPSSNASAVYFINGISKNNIYRKKVIYTGR